MTWVKVDDRFAEHPKLAAAGSAAWGTWVEALAYCNRTLTDGFIPEAIAESFGGKWRVRQGGKTWQMFARCGTEEVAIDADWIAGALVDAGLWHRVDGGYQIHDFADFQPLRADVLATREELSIKRRDAGSAGGKAKAAKQAASKSLANGWQNSSPVPVPVPVPSVARGVVVVAANTPREDKAPAEPSPTPTPLPATPTNEPDLRAACDAYQRAMPPHRGGGVGVFMPPALVESVRSIAADFGPAMVISAVEASVEAKGHVPGPAYVRRICERLRAEQRRPAALPFKVEIVKLEEPMSDDEKREIMARLMALEIQ